MLNIFIVASPLCTPICTCVYTHIYVEIKNGNSVSLTIVSYFPQYLTLKPQFSSLFLWTWLFLNILFKQNHILLVFLMLVLFDYDTIKILLLASCDAYASFHGCKLFSTVCTYHISLMQASHDRHINCFKFLTVVNRVQTSPYFLL